MIEHPNYIAGAELYRRTQKDPFFRTDEKSQFSPDITPLILAAHYNNHEIIQMFLSRNQSIDRPHPISCQCADCVTKQVIVDYLCLVQNKGLFDGPGVLFVECI